MAKWEWKTKTNKLTLDADPLGIWLVYIGAEYTMRCNIMQQRKRLGCGYKKRNNEDE